MGAQKSGAGATRDGPATMMRLSLLACAVIGANAGDNSSLQMSVRNSCFCACHAAVFSACMCPIITEHRAYNLDTDPLLVCTRQD